MTHARSTARLLLTMVAGVAWLCAGCGPSAPDLPPAPDMSALVNAYANPTGTIDPQQVDQIVGDAKARVDQIQPDWLTNLISTALVALRRRLNDGGVPTNPATQPDPHHMIMETVATLTRICQGWNNPTGTPDPARDGQIVVTAVVEEGRLRDTITGAATQCQARFQPSSAVPVSINGFVDGTMNIFLYEGLPQTVNDVHVLVEISGQIGLEGNVQSGELDFLIDFPEVQYRLPRSDGDLILSIGGPNGITLRGANGTYTCDLAGGSCVFSG
jgi:hypothetical protein